MVDEQTCEPRVSLKALFIAFLKISVCGFGSGLVWARRIAVEQRRWMSEEEFTDILSLCQFMPGPNVVGIAVCVGAKLRGLIGMIAAVSGLLLIPWTIGRPLPTSTQSGDLTRHPTCPSLPFGSRWPRHLICAIDIASDHNRRAREQLGETPDHRMAALGNPESHEVLERRH
jgi:hypothetical protein